MIWRRIAYAAALLASFVAMLYTGERVYMLVFLALIALAALLWIELLINLLTFSYNPHFSITQITAGQRVDLDMVLGNDSWLPLPYMEMKYRTLDSAYEDRLDSVAVSLPPRSQHSVPCHMEAKYRGVYHVGPTKVVLRDVLGLFALTVPVSKLTDRKLTSLTVFPRVEPLPMVSLPPQQIEGSKPDAVHQADDPAQLAGIREYRDGDPLKRIHWKQTARTRKLQVKEYEEPSRPDVLLYINRQKTEGDALSRIRAQDAMTSAAASLSYRYLSAWVPVRVVSLDEHVHITNCRRPNEFDSLLAELALMTFESENSLGSLMRMERDAILASGSVVVITETVDQELFGVLTELSGYGVSITLVMTQARDDQTETVMHEVSRLGIMVVSFNTDESLATCWEEAMGRAR